MKEIAKFTVLSRITTEFPAGAGIVTEEFQEGWSLLGSGDVQWLDERVRSCGWHFIWIAEAQQRGGVGQTEQAAVAMALRLALRRVSPQFNAATLDSIEVTRYPWFFVAKVKIYPYQIQPGMELEADDPAMPLQTFGLAGTIPAAGSLSTTAI
jgi:hypothetical protein